MNIDDSITRFEIVPWFHGKILDFSEGTVKTFQHFIWYQEVRMEDPWKLEMFSDASLDGIVSSNILHMMSMEEVGKTLTEWSRVVRDGGRIVLHLPPGESDKHRWPVSRVSVTNAMDKLKRGWDLVKCSTLETGLLCVFELS